MAVRASSTCKLICSCTLFQLPVTLSALWSPKADVVDRVACNCSAVMAHENEGKSEPYCSMGASLPLSLVFHQPFLSVRFQIKGFNSQRATFSQLVRKNRHDLQLTRSGASDATVVETHLNLTRRCNNHRNQYWTRFAAFGRLSTELWRFSRITDFAYKLVQNQVFITRRR